MSTPDPKQVPRILVIDDNRAIHDDFRKIFAAPVASSSALEAAEAELFGEAAPEAHVTFEIDSAYQGAEGLAKVKQALAEGRPYAMAFMDVRMPPGWDGIETTARIWEAYPDLQVVICTAYSDYSWGDMIQKLGISDRLLILKKPFDAVEVLQLSNALTEKWRLHQAAKNRLNELESLLQVRAKDLQKTNAELQEEVRQRRQAAEALRENEERYELLFRKNPLPMWVNDIETLKFLAVNDAAVEQYGWSAAEFLSMSLVEIRPADEVPHLLSNIKEFHSGGTNCFHVKHRHKDGLVVDVELNVREIPYSERRAHLVLANNISERKKAEDRILEQAMLLNLAHDAIFVRDLDGRIQFWNKGAERLYGWTAEQAVGSNVSDLLFQKNDKTMQVAQKILQEQGEWTGELRKRNKAGQEVVLEARWTLVRDKAGNPRSVLSIDTDVTEKKRLEAQFLRSQRMEGIGTLATGMAHDLNNILAPILVAAGTLRYDLNQKDRETALDQIEMSVKRGADIIRQVLTFGRGVSGERVAVNPSDMMLDLSNIINQTFPKNIKVNERFAAGLWPILGDKTQIHQVLLNLSINARDAMPQGGSLSLSIRNTMVTEPLMAMHGQVQPGPYIEIEITDTGCGIQASDFERIFDPFFTTKEFGKGTGLGLSTVLGIVKSHHGAIVVDSKVNEGSSFKVLLPASPEVAKAVKQGCSSGLPHGNGETVLIVDDEASIVSATRKMLEQHGYKVLIAASGSDALAAFTKAGHQIDIVVTDIMMPGMDGLALMKELKKINRDVKILPCSGLDRDLDGKKELHSFGVKAFLPKPYTAEKLLTMLREELAGAANCQVASWELLKNGHSGVPPHGRNGDGGLKFNDHPTPEAFSPDI